MLRQPHRGEGAKRPEARYHPDGEEVDAAGVCSEGRASYPGRAADSPCATAIERWRDESAEVSRGRSSGLGTKATKGRTCVEWQVMHALRLATEQKLSGDRGATACVGGAGSVANGLRCLLALGRHANGTSSRDARFALVHHRNRRMRNRMSGGVGGRRG